MHNTSTRTTLAGKHIIYTSKLKWKIWEQANLDYESMVVGRCMHVVVLFVYDNSNKN